MVYNSKTLPAGSARAEEPVWNPADLIASAVSWFLRCASSRTRLNRLLIFPPYRNMSSVSLNLA